MSSAIDSLGEELIRTVQAVVASGAISMSKHGNVSLRVPGRDELLFTAGGSLASFDREGIVDAVENVIDTYKNLRSDSERFLDTYRRVGAQPFKERLYAR